MVFLLGHHLAPQPLTSGRNVFEALGEGLTLLGLGADDSACEAFTAAAARMHVPLRVVRDSRDGGRERYQAGFVLVRPDGSRPSNGEAHATVYGVLLAGRR